MSACSSAFRAEWGGSAARVCMPQRWSCSTLSRRCGSGPCAGQCLSAERYRSQQRSARQVAWEAARNFPVVNTVSVGLIFIAVTTVSITASGSCCGRRKKAVHMALCIVSKAPGVWEDSYECRMWVVSGLILFQQSQWGFGCLLVGAETKP